MFSPLPEMLQRLQCITCFAHPECSLRVAGLECSEFDIFCFVAFLVGCKYRHIRERSHSLFLVSPEPKTEMKTLKWAISQFASVERIVGEDKYFCENCHHYTEAERSLLFDKMPEVITIHLKCFAASGLE